MMLGPPASYFFFFNDTATTEIYTLSLHDALPIFANTRPSVRPTIRTLSFCGEIPIALIDVPNTWLTTDRKSTRLNSSHSQISYAVFCLKKKKRISHDACTLGPRQPAIASLSGHVP